MKYELMVMIDPKFTDKELEKTLGEVKTSLKENDFSLLDTDDWGKRDLAYRIKGLSSAYYSVMTFEGEGKGSTELHKDLRIMPGVVRYLLTKVPDIYVLTRYNQGEARPAASRKLKSKHAEELSQKVRSSKKPKTDAENSGDTKKLDEQLQAIIDKPDIAV